jgi:formylglycine-generating enzyme required for sulfatase activity
MKIWLLAALLCLGCSRAEGAALPADSSGPPVPEPKSTPAASPEPAAKAACTPGCSSIERCEQGRCVPSCPAGEVYVPATGERGFEMGRGRRGAFDQRHTVVLTKPFCMDQTEVTVRAYRACVEAGKCTIPQLLDANSNYRAEFRHDDHPLNMVNWQQASTYCAGRGQALPTEAQFEWAAGHGDGRSYPWGNDEPTCDSGHADFTPGGTPKTDPAGDHGCHGGNTSPVRAHARGRSSWPAGDLYDLGGNVWEWTADCYLAHPDGAQVDPSPQKHEKLAGDCYMRALRGGGWNRSKQAMHPWWRAGSKRTYRVPGLGFRCVRNPS